MVLAGLAEPSKTQAQHPTEYRISNRRHKVTTPSGTTTYTYTERGQLDQETSPFYTVTYEYNDAGDQTRTIYPWATISTGYDPQHRKTAETDQGTSQTITYAYDLAGNRTVVDFPPDQTTVSVYDARNREQLSLVADPATYKTHEGASTLKDVQFVYDIFGNRIQKKVDANGDGDFTDSGDSITKTVYDGENVYAEFDGRPTATCTDPL